MTGGRYPILKVHCNNVYNFDEMGRDDQYICSNIDTFMDNVRNVAKKEGIFDGIFDIDGESKWPCLVCSEEEYTNQIRDNLLKLGYKECTMMSWKGKFNPYIITNGLHLWNYMGGCIQILDGAFNSCLGRYVCQDIDTFLHDAREVSMREERFKERDDLDKKA